MRRSLLARLERLEQHNPANGGFLLVPAKAESLEEWVRQHHLDASEGSEPISQLAQRHEYGFSHETGPLVSRHGRVLEYQLRRPS